MIFAPFGRFSARNEFMLRLSKDWIESLTFCCRCWVDITKSGRKQRFQFTFFIRSITLLPYHSYIQGIPKTVFFTNILVTTVRPADFEVVILILMHRLLLVPQFSGSMGYPHGISAGEMQTEAHRMVSPVNRGRRREERRKSEEMTLGWVGTQIEALVDVKLAGFPRSSCFYRGRRERRVTPIATSYRFPNEFKLRLLSLSSSPILCLITLCNSTT